MKPTETTRGMAWLANFPEEERQVAARLLDGLQIFSPVDQAAGIKKQIRSLDSDLQDGSGLLVPVLSIEDIDRALHDAGSAVPLKGSTRHTAWTTYTPGMSISATPGSEGMIGGLVRDITGETPGGEPGRWLHPRSSIDDLRRGRCRLLVLVTDYSGSGNQVIEFARTFVRHPTIRSWRSFGWLRVVVVAHAVSAIARRKIESSGAIDRVVVAIPAASIEDADWSDPEREQVVGLCSRYAPRTKGALGYGGSGGLYMTHSAVPNNLPYVVRRQGVGWHPFVDGRIFPADLVAELEGYRVPQRDLADVAGSVRQVRLARAMRPRYSRKSSDRLLAVLALLTKRRFSTAEMSHKLAIPEAEIESLVGFLRRSGMINDGRSVTERGRIELAAGKHLPREATAHLAGSDDPYYPRSLR